MKLKEHPHRFQILCGLICASLFTLLTIYVSFSDSKANKAFQKGRVGQQAATGR